MGVIGKINAEGTTHLIAPTVYGTCSTAAATAAKTVTIDGFTLMTGITIWVKFTNNNTASNPTLSINNGTAIPIKMFGTSAAGTTSTTSWYSGGVVALTYDGTNWLIDNYKQDTDTINILHNGAYFPVGTGGIQKFSLFMKSYRGSYSSFTSTSGTETNKTLNDIAFDLRSPVYYNPNSTNYTANRETGNVYTACPIDARYSFNITTSSFTKGKPVFLVFVKDNDDYYTLDSTPWTQTSPNSDDGKYYKYLGIAYSGYQLYLSPENPVFTNSSWLDRVESGNFRVEGTFEAAGKTLQVHDGTIQTKGDILLDFNDNIIIPLDNSNDAVVLNRNTCSFNTNVDINKDLYINGDNNGKLVLNNNNNSTSEITSIYDIIGSTSDLGYSTQGDAQSKLPTICTLAFWNGKFNSNFSNLAYCNKGAFGTMATKNSVSQSDLVNDFLYGLVVQAEATLTAVNVAQNTWVSLGQLSLSRGKYIFIAKAQVELNTGTSYTSGYFSLGVVTGTTKTAHSKFDTKVNSNAWLITENVRTLTLTKDTTVSIFGYQTLVSGSTVGAKVTPSYSYIKLK